jgi:hypothetical protein
MRKISLDVSALRVESFDTEGEKPKEQGTVHAYYSRFTCPETQCGNHCQSGPWPGCPETYAWTDGYQGCLCGINQSLDCP